MTNENSPPNNKNSLAWGEIEKSVVPNLPAWVSNNFFSQLQSAVNLEVHRNPKLGDCSPISLTECIVECACLGLLPSRVTGHAYLIPYKGKSTLVVGYKGIITLLCRNKDIQCIYPRAVREGDDFQIEYGTDEKLIHRPNTSSKKGAISHFYAVITYKSGIKQFEVMTKEQVDRIKADVPYNKLWDKEYEAMGLKTVIRKIAKYVPSNSMYDKFLDIDNKAQEVQAEQKTWEGDYHHQNTEQSLTDTLNQEEEITA